MSRFPFNNSTNFPLVGTTFGSRIQSQIFQNKNYVFLGFKPGFPLQASELNEIQENFHVQQTLNSEMMFNWMGNSGISGPAWQGATPVKPELLDRTTTSGTSTTVVLSPGWLFIKNQSFMGGLGMWIYNPSTYTFTATLATDATYGIAVKTQEIDSIIDSTINDNSGGPRNIYGQNTAGANRIKIILDAGIYSSNSLPGSNYTYMPIFKTVATTTPTLSSSEVYTINNYKVT